MSPPAAREPGFVVWFTGLSGSGKTTLGALLGEALRERGLHVEVLDGDEVRQHLSRGLGFSRQDRDTNVERIGYVAGLLARAGTAVVVSAISPYREARARVRAGTPRFCEVHCDCPLETLIARDPKGLYRRALAGELPHFTGVDDPYEVPDAPDVRLYTGRDAPEVCLRELLDHLERRGWAPAGRPR